MPVLPRLRVVGSEIDPVVWGHYLTGFVKQLASLEFVYNSDEFQLFLRGPEDFEKVVRKLSFEFKDVSMAYQNIFHRYLGVVYNEGVEGKLFEFETYLNGVESNLKRIKLHLKGACTSYRAFSDSFVDLLIMLGDADEERTNEGRGPEQFQGPPFYLIYDWVQQESDDLAAVLEVLQNRQILAEAARKAEDKHENDSQQLARVQGGRLSLSYLFARRKQEFLSSLETSIRELHEDAEHLRVLLRLVSIRIYKEELPAYVTRKRWRYQELMKRFAESSLREFKGLMDFIQFRFNDCLI